MSQPRQPARAEPARRRRQARARQPMEQSGGGAGPRAGEAELLPMEWTEAENPRRENRRDMVLFSYLAFLSLPSDRQLGLFSIFSLLLRAISQKVACHPTFSTVLGQKSLGRILFINSLPTPQCAEQPQKAQKCLFLFILSGCVQRLRTRRVCAAKSLF
jgi:hypothetical protein